MQRRDRQGRIYYDRPGELAERPIPVRFGKQVDGLLRKLPDRSGYIRRAVEEQLRRDGLLD